MEKILITGGSGFIGRHFINRLTNAEVVILDLVKPTFNSHAHFIQGDIRNRDDVNRAMKDVDTVIHLAAMHHDFGIRDQEYENTNVTGAKILAEEAANQGVKRIINFSSVAVYGAAGTPGPTTEETPAIPTSAYGKSKLQAESVFSAWAVSNPQRKVVTIRSTVVFGPWNLANVLNLIRMIHKGLYLQIGKGNNIKSLAYVGNIVDAALFAMENSDFGYHLFNYADEPHLTSRQIAEMQAKMLNRKIKFTVPLSVGIALAMPFDLAIAFTGKNLSISSKRVKKLQTQTYHTATKILRLGFKPKVSIYNGMQEMIRWYLNSLKKE